MYYGFNFNRPVGRVNLLRAYDVTSNNFSLNQASVLMESAPDPAAGRRFGGRLDLQYGQATETLQGSLANEPRPVGLPQHLPGVRHVRVSARFRPDRGPREVGELDRAREQLHQGSGELLPFVLVQLSALLSHGCAGDVPLQRRGRGELLDDQRHAADRSVQQLQGSAVRRRAQPGEVGRRGRRTSTSGRSIRTSSRSSLDLASRPPTQPGLSIVPIVPALDGRLHILDSYATWQADARTSLLARGRLRRQP